MASDNAAAVAKEVLETIGKGEKVSKRQIIRKHGYAQNTADNPKLVTETKTYKETVRPFIERLQAEIERIHSELESRTLTGEKYKDLVESLDKLNKQVQLATGGETERIGLKIEISEAIAKKNDLNDFNTGAEQNS